MDNKLNLPQVFDGSLKAAKDLSESILSLPVGNQRLAMIQTLRWAYQQGRESVTTVEVEKLKTDHDLNLKNEVLAAKYNLEKHQQVLEAIQNALTGLNEDQYD